MRFMWQLGPLVALHTCVTHVCDKILTWSRVTLCGMPVRASCESSGATALGLHWSCILVMLHEVVLWRCCGSTMFMLWLLLWLLYQPGENKCLQFLQLINSSSSLLACALSTLGFSKQYKQWGQQENWHHKQDQQDTHVLATSIHLKLICP